MFKVTDCILTSKNGEDDCKITLSGTGYDYLYVGTSAERMLADKSSGFLVLWTKMVCIPIRFRFLY